jgi:hypothetical protein
MQLSHLWTIKDSPQGSHDYQTMTCWSLWQWFIQQPKEFFVDGIHVHEWDYCLKANGDCFQLLQYLHPWASSNACHLYAPRHGGQKCSELNTWLFTYSETCTKWDLNQRIPVFVRKFPWSPKFSMETEVQPPINKRLKFSWWFLWIFLSSWKHCQPVRYEILEGNNIHP